NGKVLVKYIRQVNGTKTVQEDSLPLSEKKNLLLKVRTDDPGQFFSVRLKEKLGDEKSIFKNVQKQFVLSDIEGNFGAFRKLLEANGVINNELNWTFGNGHLVLIGDFFDRGDQVTEVLWFIYLLEEKAKAAGGYVHFILGNHEIMNLSSDLRYLNTKYTMNAELLHVNYESLYAENTELGKWLRTKNIMERIGEVLFIHGGVSADVNRLAMSAKDVNQLARPYYADTTYNYKDPRLNFIFGDLGPFWYRGYYAGKTKVTEPQIDSILGQYNVRHIVTGHTIVADTVSAWFHGKLFNTDTHHAEGKSEALMIEGNRYYRVNAVGNKVPLTDK
ncbi:MAG: hypothetical protein JWM28_2785, partial [Chitinophagaceae bacterium]|nr:hypothetical protein [Chitinophagaceae bacterium]